MSILKSQFSLTTERDILCTDVIDIFILFIYYEAHKVSKSESGRVLYSFWLATIWIEKKPQGQTYLDTTRIKPRNKVYSTAE